MIERSDFGDRQAEMTARWFENVKRVHGDVDAYIAKRQEAYLDRWKEAGRFIQNGSSVLDVGGGNLYEKLISYFMEREFKYSYRDVDHGAVHSSRDIIDRMGLNSPSVAHGFNDELDFPDNSFDALFSSHCIEHSIDLNKTFQEIFRVLRPGGNLLMAVPFGWEMNPEHPYFFGPNEWVVLAQDAGFEIRVAQIGYEYPELGADYFIAARKTGKAPEFRIDPTDYRKESFTFVDPDDSSIAYSAGFELLGDKAQSLVQGSSLVISPPEGAIQILPIMHRHSWSGRITIHSGSRVDFDDLYSWFSYDMPTAPIPVSKSCDGNSAVTIVCDRRSATSHWCEMIFKGYMWR